MYALCSMIDLKSITRLQLSCYTEEEDVQLRVLKSLKQVELFHLTQDELKRVLTHIQSITEYWRRNGLPEWGLEGIIFRG